MARAVDTNGEHLSGWGLIVVLAAVCATACFGLDFRFSGLAPILSCLLLLVAALAFAKVTMRPRLYAGANAFLLMTLFTVTGVVLSYALAARGGALWDADLARLDQLLGFDWPAFYQAADQFPGLLWVGGLAYHSLPLQMIVCIVALSGAGQTLTLRTAVSAALLSGFATILISGLVPAMGNVFDPGRYARLWPSVAWMERDMLTGLRDGAWRTVNVSHLWGIVTFPSYHATLPLILAWAQRDVPWLRVLAPIWAAVTVLATPLFGGHYGVDVLAGIAIAPVALAVASSRAWRRLEQLGRSRSAQAGFAGRRPGVNGAVDALA